MSNRINIRTIIFALSAIGFFCAAGMMQTPIKKSLNKSELISPEAQKILQTDPQLALVKAMPGGLRALGLNYFWLRSRLLHEQGRHFDAYDLAKVICILQPHRAEVWDFQSWNMAWNISVMCKTKQERWRWIYNGIRLLRDRGIPHNPDEGKLDKALSWIFLNKFSDEIDEMHLTYKQRWGGTMQRVMGMPIHDLKINSFDYKKSAEYNQISQIATGLIDRDPRLQGEFLIQPSQAKEMSKRPHVKKYLDRLKPYKLGLDPSFLYAYNRVSNSPTEAYCWLQPFNPTKKQKVIYDILNDKSDDALKAREEILAFLRAQVLWNRYKMDPKKMLAIMDKYQAPLDWRHTASHALYWAEQGDEKMKPRLKLNSFVRLNNNRFILFALKDLMYRGKVSVKFMNKTTGFNVPPSIMNYPDYQATLDLRMIKPIFETYKRLNAELYKDKRKMEVEQDMKLIAGFKSFLQDAILLLVADDQIAFADKLFKYYKNKLVYADELKLIGDVSVEDFAKNEFVNIGTLRSETAIPIISIAIKRAILAKAIYKNKKEYQKQLKIAKTFFYAYEKTALERYKQKSKEVVLDENSLSKMFSKFVERFITLMIVRPEIIGLNLTMDQRSDIYQEFMSNSDLICNVYKNIITTELRGSESIPCQIRILCNSHNMNFDTAFPKPAGFDEFFKKYIQELRRQQNSEK